MWNPNNFNVSYRYHSNGQYEKLILSNIKEGRLMPLKVSAKSTERLLKLQRNFILIIGTIELGVSFMEYRLIMNEFDVSIDIVFWTVVIKAVIVFCIALAIHDRIMLNLYNRLLERYSARFIDILYHGGIVDDQEIQDLVNKITEYRNIK